VTSTKIENLTAPLEHEAKTSALETVRAEVPSTSRTPDEPKQSETTKQILAQGVRLVGLPLTLAGLFRVIEDLEKRSKITDNLLASVAIIFLVSWIAAFLSVRPNQAIGRTLEQISTALFYIGLTAMVLLIGLMVLGV
jgi:hypothetical protein